MIKNETQTIRLVVFDWAGTTVDFGSRAPAKAFTNVFAAHGVRVIKAIEEHAELVPQLLEVVDQLRSSGLRIGGTTGYFREAAKAVARRAAHAGFEPDANVCADDVPQGRPAPWMIYRVMEQLGIYPPSAVVKVGDTVADIRAGLAAGCWSVGVCDSSSLTGLSLAEYADLSADEKSDRLRQSVQAFRDAGSHAVINSISDLPSLIDQLNRPLVMIRELSRRFESRQEVE